MLSEAFRLKGTKIEKIEKKQKKEKKEKEDDKEKKELRVSFVLVYLQFTAEIFLRSSFYVSVNSEFSSSPCA